VKLTPALVERTLVQFNAMALPDDHTARPKLEEVFGEHTFLINDDGLHVVEALPLDTGKMVGQVVKLASWKDANQTSLTPHEPEPTNVVVALDTAA
jgi:hypothetical protein